MDKQQMEQLADQLCDVMRGKPELSFAANEAVANALGLKMNEQEIYEWQGGDYTQDQLVQYLAPLVLDRLSVQEALSYAFELHKEYIDLVEPGTQIPSLQEQPWLFPELLYRFVNGSGDAYYSNSPPQFSDRFCNWAISSLTLQLKVHKLKGKYQGWGGCH